MTNFINKYKNLLKGLFAVLLTIAFAGSVRYLAVEDNNVLWLGEVAEPEAK